MRRKVKRKEEVSKVDGLGYGDRVDVGNCNPFKYTTAKGLIRICKGKYDVKVTRSEIENMCKLDLLEFVSLRKQGIKAFPCFIADRIVFIKKLKSKYNYPNWWILQIILTEREFLSYLREAYNYCGDRENVYAWFICRYKIDLDSKKELVEILKIVAKQYADDNDEKMKKYVSDLLAVAKKDVSSIRKLINDISTINWNKIPNKGRDELTALAFKQQMMDEQERKFNIEHYYKMILSGYSPQVVFEAPKTGGIKIDMKKVDWFSTIETVKLLIPDMDFFLTPYFTVEKNGKEIIIKIIEPGEVSAPLKGNIDKIYTVFKNSMKLKRKGWGENSGRKNLIRKRNSRLKELYSELRKEKPNVAARFLIDRLIEETKKTEFPVHSVERMKNIIYTKNMS
jgi:transcription termination factor NusB